MSTHVTGFILLLATIQLIGATSLAGLRSPWLALLITLMFLTSIGMIATYFF